MGHAKTTTCTAPMGPLARAAAVSVLGRTPSERAPDMATSSASRPPSQDIRNRTRAQARETQDKTQQTQLKTSSSGPATVRRRSEGGRAFADAPPAHLSKHPTRAHPRTGAHNARALQHPPEAVTQPTPSRRASTPSKLVPRRCSTTRPSASGPTQASNTRYRTRRRNPLQGQLHSHRKTGPSAPPQRHHSYISCWPPPFLAPGTFPSRRSPRVYTDNLSLSLHIQSRKLKLRPTLHLFSRPTGQAHSVSPFQPC